jgi:formate/nitrite transporter FocA (FNT family)
VTLGNLVGGFIFTGLALYVTYKPQSSPAKVPVPTPTAVPAE